MSRIIGIDLGTSLSGAAIFIKNAVTMIPDEEGNVLIPSIVAYNDKQIIVGKEARYQMVNNPENTIYHVKRIIGRGYDEPCVQQDKKTWPFHVVKEEPNECRVNVFFNNQIKTFSPEQISSRIIKKLKETSENYLGQLINEAVISVPAYFNNNQRAATKNAGKIAKLQVKHIINEPTAAALAYGFGRVETDKRTKNVVVYDLGGGTFDISILRIIGREFKVLSIDGDTHLGGEDFTNRMITHCFQEFLTRNNIAVELSTVMRNRLREACEKAKKNLSDENCSCASVELDNFYKSDDDGEIELLSTLSRKKFEDINRDLFNMTITIVDKCMSNAKLTANQIDDVILVGGSTRIPKIRNLLADKFGIRKVNTSVNPTEAVALGAAIEAAILSDNMSERIRNTKLVDVIPLSLGIKVDTDEKMLKIIERNTPIPIRKRDSTSTMHDNQSNGLFPIYEGENYYVKDNIYLGEFTLDNIPQGPAGSVKFDVMFEVDNDGILTVTTTERTTSVTDSIKIKKDFRRLTQEEIDMMTAEDTENETIGRENQRIAIKKRKLERYTYDVSQFLLLESTQEKITGNASRKCRNALDTVRKNLFNYEDVTEQQLDGWISDIKKVCDPFLNELFKEKKGRNIGEPKSFRHN